MCIYDRVDLGSEHFSAISEVVRDDLSIDHSGEHAPYNVGSTRVIKSRLTIAASIIKTSIRH